MKQLKVLGSESVTVPAGTFDQAALYGLEVSLLISVEPW
jgi:hypothetical protein